MLRSILALLAVGVVGVFGVSVAAERDATVLLITDESLAQAWQPFAEFKTQIGLATEIVTVQAIESEYEGDDTPAKIRACVLANIDKRNTRFVILGGDSKFAGGGLVPHRTTPHLMPLSNQPTKLPTDLYYISPEGKDWDANDDGVYGDWETDREAVAYTHPSGACIGRIPVRTAGDVAAYTEKIRGYELRYPTGGFAEGIVYSNTVEMLEPKVRRSWDDYLSKAWTGGRIYRFLHTETAWDEEKPADYALNADHWLEVLNRPTAGKMHMHGHGFLPAWVLEHPTGTSYVSADVVNKLTNKDAYLVMTTVSCFTGSSMASPILALPSRCFERQKKGRW